MKYKLIQINYGIPVITVGQQTYTQPVFIVVGIDGDTHGFTVVSPEVDITIDWSLGTGIPAYINEQAQNWVTENYPSN